MNKTYLIRCDGGNIPEIGTGHIYRCLVIARKLKKTGHKIYFISRCDGQYSWGFNELAKQGFPVLPITGNNSELAALAGLIKRIGPDIVIFDRLNTEESIARLAAKNAILITFDDAGEGQKFADITINAVVGREKTIYSGYDYSILSHMGYRAIHLKPAVSNIFISFGGYDHLNNSLSSLKALEGLSRRIRITLALRKSYPAKEELAGFLKKSKRKFNIVWDSGNIAGLIAQADLALTSAGLTLLESLSVGVPTIVINQYGHQEEIAQALDKKEVVINLGIGSKVSAPKIKKSVYNLMRNFKLRQKLHINSLCSFDGYSLDRVMELVRFCEKRPWDTNFFKLNIAELYPLRVNEKMMRIALKMCCKDKIRCLYYLCDCHDPLSVKLAEKYGFHFVDIRLNFSLDLSNYSPPRPAGGAVTFGKFRSLDLPYLKKIAGAIYSYSRYYFDLNFPRKSCSRFYVNWLAKCCHEENKKVFVARIGNRAVGYVTARISNKRAYLDLVGVDKTQNGRKIGAGLLKYALDSLKEDSICHVEVVTQGRNYAAQRLYQSCGFKTLKTQLWYHKWFDI